MREAAVYPLMTLSSHPVPPRLLARFLDHEPVELARGQDKTQLADVRALTAQMGRGWRVERVVSRAPDVGRKERA